MTTFDLDRHLAECRARMRDLTDGLFAHGVKQGDEFVNTDGARMRVAQVVTSGGLPTAVWLTDDGEWADTVHWHSEDPKAPPVGDDDWVRVERYTLAGMAFHGFVHRKTRRLLQTG